MRRGRNDDSLPGAINLTELVRGMFSNGYLGYCIGAGHERWALLAEQWRPR